MPTSSCDVLIVGAGPVGLTMAAALNDHGIKCRIIDKAPTANDKSKALVVWSRTLELLDKLGLAETFVATGMKINGASMYHAGERLVHIQLTGADSPFGFPLMIPQNETERLLTEHLASRGVTIERQIELVDFGEQAEKVVCQLRHANGSEEQLDVPWMVGCDGAHSTVRHTLGLEFSGSAEPNDWILADVHIKGPIASDELSIFWHEKGVLVFFPITPTRYRVIADLGMAHGDGKPADPTLADAQAKVDERGPGGITLTDPVWLAGFRINERKVSDYRHGRVMLAGDAAHIHSPAGGQGMNTGMQDAFNLAWKLALVQKGRGRIEPLLDSYSNERSAIGDQVLRAAERLTTVATLRNPVAQFMRNHIAPIVTSFGFVQDKIRDMMCELSINYHGSPLVKDDWPLRGGGIAAGERLPDAPLTSIDGSASTLLVETRSWQHHLLLFPCSHDAKVVNELTEIADQVSRAYPGLFPSHVFLPAGGAASEGPSPSPSPEYRGGGFCEPADVQRKCWLDADGKLHEKFGAEHPTAIVVRPDGYIGYRCQPANVEKVLAWLGEFLES
jgi:2-polyprenyl-6-methoxyphenol hydroxylase-like FAD-dependent oxidoreductase